MSNQNKLKHVTYLSKKATDFLRDKMTESEIMVSGSEMINHLLEKMADTETNQKSAEQNEKMLNDLAGNA